VTDPDDLKRRTSESFTRSAEAYVKSAGHAHGRDLERLVELAAPRPGELALDVATGGGHTARALAAAGACVVASDLTAGMLAAARQAGSEGIVAWVQGDAEILPFGSGIFGIVSCRIAAHHFPSVPRFLAEVARVLAPGGRLALEDSVAPDHSESARVLDAAERLHDPTHVLTLSAAAWDEGIAAAGLRLEASERHGKRHVLDDWCPRPGMSDEARAELERGLLAASPDARAVLKLEVEKDRPVAFSDEKIVLLARKPA